MSNQWTPDQKKVIDLRNRNLLVSAAAGSGKTAVLIERILNLISDPVRPVDIDELLVVTFTRAAAGEMRERLNTAIEKKLSEGEEEEHLTRQLTLIQSAQITTIDSFCSYILKSYFHVIGLDPNYRVMDEGEGKLLKTQVVQELLESYFEEATPEFQEFVECLATGKNDQILEDSILRLYEFAMSYPYPEKWLEECLSVYSAGRWKNLKMPGGFRGGSIPPGNSSEISRNCWRRLFPSVRRMEDPISMSRPSFPTWKIWKNARERRATGSFTRPFSPWINGRDFPRKRMKRSTKTRKNR